MSEEKIRSYTVQRDRILQPTKALCISESTGKILQVWLDPYQKIAELRPLPTQGVVVDEMSIIGYTVSMKE